MDLSLSVVVPVYNEADRIEDCLRSILDQDCEEVQEVIVVDDASTDGTLSILKRLADEYPKMKYLTRDENKGRAYTRSEGFAEAEGDYVVFVDSDCRLSSNSLNVIADEHEVGADVVYGYVDVANDDKFYPMVNKVHRKFSPPQRYGTPLMSVDKEEFERIGGFRDMRGEDVEVKHRLKELEVSYADEAVVESRFPEDWGYIARKKVLLGKTGVDFAYMHPSEYGPGEILDLVKVPAFYTAFGASLLISLRYFTAMMATVTMAVFFLYVHLTRALEMVRESDKLAYGVLYFPYSAIAEMLQTYGFYTRFPKFLRFVARKLT